MGTGRIFPKG